MKTAATLKKLGKAALAVLLALLVLDIFCLVYFNRPSHAKSISGATDYTWEPNSAYFDMTEGFAFNRTNNEGYFNPYDYEEGMRTDILILGASQMQSASVQMKDSAPVLLSEKLGGKRVYNLGMAGHLFGTLASNLPAALEKYRPEEYVVMEMETVTFTDENLKDMLNDTIPEMVSYSGGLVNLMQRVDIFRLLYSQLSSYLEFHSFETASAEEYHAPTDEKAATLAFNSAAAAPENESAMSNEELMRAELAKLKACADDYGVKLIILYDPKCFYTEQGYLWFAMGDEAVLFDSICQEEGIIFVNMCPRFQEEFAGDGTVPYGFANTSKGEGHLNRDGHAMIADELYKAITS